MEAKLLKIDQCLNKQWFCMWCRLSLFSVFIKQFSLMQLNSCFILFETFGSGSVLHFIFLSVHILFGVTVLHY